MSSLLPRFTAQRMVMDYVRQYYGPASKHGRLLGELGNPKAPTELSRWKKKINELWPDVSLRRVDDGRTSIDSGKTMKIEVAASLNGLTESDVVMECLVGNETENDDFIVQSCYTLKPRGHNSAGEIIFTIDLTPPLPGLQFYELRMYPRHKLLAHPFEAGYMLWL